VAHQRLRAHPQATEAGLPPSHDSTRINRAEYTQDIAFGHIRFEEGVLRAGLMHASSPNFTAAA